MGFQILTYCSQAYLPALEWVLPSWTRPDVEQIHVVSDFGPMGSQASWEKQNVVWHPDYEPSEDWFINNTRRAEVAWKYAPSSGLWAFLDLDCWIRGDVLPAFGPPNTISVTRFWSKERHTGGTITDGTWYANMGPNVKVFLGRWVELTKSMGRFKAAHGRATTQQYAFTKLCRDAFRTGVPCHINTVPEQIYNCEHSVPARLIKKASENSPVVIHFKGGTWNNAQFVKRVLRAAGDKP